MKRFQRLAWFLVVVMVLSACSANPLEGEGSAAEGESSAHQDFTPAKKSDLKRARDKWASQGVTHYSMTVQHVESVWHAQSYEIVVEGELASHSASCIPAPTEGGKCEVEDYDPEAYTVQGLFDTVEWLLESKLKEWVRVEFDEEYGYPRSIRVDDPEILDEDNAWSVRDFEVLP